MKKLFAILLAVMMLLPCIAMAEMTDEELHAWALANGYVKVGVDAISSATTNKAGGVNYGAIEWNEELQVAAIKEFLKGGHYLGSADFAQDESGYNYREMYQMATSYNNIPSNTNLELVLDASTLHLLGVSEAGTSKTIQFQMNPNVSISWCRQLRIAEEVLGYNYYCSYGVQFDGVVRVYTAADLATQEGQEALLNLFDKYYPTLASNWGAYNATFANAATAEEVRAGKLSYITNSLNGGAMVIYEVIPTQIIVTAPFLMNMSPSMANASRFTAVQEGEDKYAYELGLSDAFLDRLVAYKADFIATEEGKAAVESYYSTGMYPMLDQYCAAYGAPTSLDLALIPTNAAGLKTQTTWTPASDDHTGAAQGFHSAVSASVTLNEDGTIAAVVLDTTGETAGIGTKVGESEEFAAQFIGKTGPFTLGAGIDAVAGATVTSEAAVNAINNAIK